VVVQLGPGIGQAAFVELGVGFHEGLAYRSVNRRKKVAALAFAALAPVVWRGFMTK